MELSSEVLDGIQILGDSVHIKDSSFSPTLEFVFGSLLFGKTEPGKKNTFIIAHDLDYTVETPGADFEV